MTFNKGFLCPSCGPIPTAKKSSRNKVQFDVCLACSNVVSKWERPLNERAGRCGNCGGGAFTLAVWKGDILRKCKTCDEVFNVDKNEVTRKGKKEHVFRETL